MCLLVIKSTVAGINMYAKCVKSMGRVTVTLDERHEYEIEAQVRMGEAESQSGSVRHLIDEYARLQQEYEDLHTEYEHLQARRDELEQRLTEAHNKIEPATDLVEYVEAEKTAQERWREAGILGKAKYTLLGMPSDDE